jgi:RimJ/RimL family protein N-acetyltransferase
MAAQPAAETGRQKDVWGVPRDDMTIRETARLRLRAWREDDLEPLAAIDGDPEVMAFVGDGRTRTREQTAASLGWIRQAWDEQGFGLFAVEVKETGQLAGWVGLAVPFFLPEIMPAVEIGWRLGRAHWGHGYATEAAREALDFGFRDAGLDRIVSIRDVRHHVSAGVMRKLGMTEFLRTAVPSHGQPVLVTEITRERWAASSAAANGGV